MLNRFFGNNTHLYLHLFGLSVLAVGIPFNKIVMSISMMFLVLNLLLEGEFKTYWNNLKSNKIYLLVLGFILLHLISFAWSSNLDYALHDFKVKLPLLVIPTVLAAKPLSQRAHLDLILKIFTGTVLIISVINISLYQHWIGSVIYDDIRGLSHFSSHIRFSIIVSMAIAISFYFFLKANKKSKIGYALIIIWLILYTLYSQVISGVLTMSFAMAIYWLHLLWKKSKVIAAAPVLIGLISFIVIVAWVFKPVSFDFDKEIDRNEKTIEGNEYIHVPEIISAETNVPTHIYLCLNELSRDWGKYSTIPFDSLDIKGQPISETIIRYLSSKELRKDAKGLSKLTQKEISEIEIGITSANHKGLIGRLYGVKYQIINVDNPNGHSLIQRLEYWKTGGQIAKKNLIIGVGAGDVQDVFNEQYVINNSLLSDDKRRRAHNYYLSVLITFGLIGLIYFMYLTFFFIKSNIGYNELLALCFMVIVLVSFLIEDTIETQTGVTFYAFFYGLFSYKNPPS